MTPSIVVCDHEKELAERLIHTLRDAHGATVRVFVRDSATETLVVILPEHGPSLAQALRDWVADWWSEGDETDYGSPERHLAGFGIVIEPGEYAVFSTSCPYCGVNDQLTVVGGTFQVTGIPVDPSGFALADAQTLETEDEEAYCDACQRTFSPDDIRL